MTYLSLIKSLTDLGASSPAHEASELVRVLAGKPREWCLLHRDEILPDSIDRAVADRQRGVPLQYILGEAYFYGYRFTVSPDCLIPQPDTEHLVMLALELIGNGTKILDLCTGSGCIAISILKEIPRLCASAVDISPDALRIARQNAELHLVSDRLTLIEADVLTADLSKLMHSADLVVSNPPYINTDVIPTLSDEVQHEPHIALDGGPDGMVFYRHFITKSAQLMKSDAMMLLEIGYDQADRIAELCNTQDLSCTFHKDFGGNIRVAQISRK